MKKEQYPKTLTMLAARVDFHERQLRLIKSVQTVIESGRGFSHEAHIQCDGLYFRPVIMTGSDLAKILVEARNLCRAYNSDSGGNRFELFICSGELRVAIASEDANILAAALGLDLSFRHDKRIADGVNPMVFEQGDKLPSAWYAEKPTTMPEPAMATG